MKKRPILRKLLWAMSVLAIAVGGLASWLAWHLLLLPSSWAEWHLRGQFEQLAQKDTNNSRLADRTNFEWVDVCSHHPYNGDFHYAKYGRTYRAPMEAAHDGVWVLLFIAKDGQPTYINGSCKRGGVEFAEFSCVSRERAVLRRVPGGICPKYAMKPDVDGK